jgi:osmoprotectant transport system ATP-binding protein
MTATAKGEPMIRLERLEKRFPGAKEPAVEALSMDIPEGEIVVFVGPSGCGKTTTMKMINRIIEPTGGRIVLEGEDVTKANPDRLRRRIGYVIQQVGLFPHQTIAENISTVPKLLGWEGKRVSERVDELLELVSMDPAEFRHRYPKELSGGQRQRVGVARALAADPPVMLMDEPFGAIDPITRERLQNEFLRVQEDIRKTIVFVTHDIDEAIKMGDRIAILRDRSVIAQYDTPENVLSAPADGYVENFIGAGASLKRLNLTRIRDIEMADWPVARQGTSREEALTLIRRSGRGALLVIDEEGRPMRWLDGRDLMRSDRPLEELGSPPEAIVQPQTSLHGALNEMLTARYGVATVVDGHGAYLGTIDMQTIMDAVKVMREEARARALSGVGLQEQEEVTT